MTRVKKLNVLPQGTLPPAVPLPELTPAERVEFERTWAAWQAELARDRELSPMTKKALRTLWDAGVICAYAVLLLGQVALALLGLYALLCLGGMFALCAGIMAVGCVLWCFGAAPVMGVQWAWQKLTRRSGAAG